MSLKDSSSLNLEYSNKLLQYHLQIDPVQTRGLGVSLNKYSCLRGFLREKLRIGARQFPKAAKHIVSARINVTDRCLGGYLPLFCFLAK